MTAPRQILPPDDEKGVPPPVPKNTPETTDDAAILFESSKLGNNDLSAKIEMLAHDSSTDVVIDFTDYISGFVEDVYWTEENTVDESAVEAILIQMTEGAMSLDEVLQYREAISDATRAEVERRYNALQAADANEDDGQDEVIEMASVATLPSPSLARAIGMLFSGAAINVLPQNVGEEQEQEKEQPEKTEARPTKSV